MSRSSCKSDVLKTIEVIAIATLITALEIFNIVYHGIDGAILVFIISVLAGLAGYKIGSIRIPSEEQLEREEAEK